MKKIIKSFISVICAAALLSLNFSVSVSAEENGKETTVMPSGFSAADFDEAAKKVKRNDREISYASAAVGFFQGDEILFTGHYGEIDLENHIPADENSVYEWGSISKTFIWVSVMQLWEQGKIDLDKDIREYLPEGFFRNLAYDEPITMMNLMNHNAGWQETTHKIFVTDEKDILPLGEALREIEPVQVFRPGDVDAYSNYGAAVAGYIVELVSGMDYCDYVHKNILEPLGMEHTAINPDHSDNEWVREQRKKLKIYDINTMLNTVVDKGNKLEYLPCYPAGAAAGTLGDLIKYAQAFVNDDAPLFRNKETQEILFSGTDFYGDSDIPVCAHGFWCEEYNVRVYGHSGATTGCRANMLFDRESKVGMAVLVNERSGNWFLENAPYYAFGDLKADAHEKLADADVSGYYLMSRSNHKGMLKYIPYITAGRLDTLGNAEDIGNNVYQIRIKDTTGEPDTAILLGKNSYSDGRSGFKTESMEFIRDDNYVMKLFLLMLYVLAAIISVYFLRIQLKLKKSGRPFGTAGTALMTADRFMKPVSVISLLASYVIYSNNVGGISPSAGTVISIIQIICTAVCVISAVISLKDIFSKKDINKYIYIINTAANVFAVSAIVYFEMYLFI